MAKNSSGTIFGHPKGLYVLFFTELWERFSFYGMKTLLILYMLNHYMWSQEDASSLLGTYGMLAYGLPVVGGFIADRYIGQRRAVMLGAALLSIGHLCMIFAEELTYFYGALGLIIAGVAFLKPNISTQVGSLYKPGDPRRDGAFTIFYMGINLGALFGPFICDWLRVHYGYHYGFAAAGVGMIFGLIVYVLGQRTLVEFNQKVEEDGGPSSPSDAPVLEQPSHVVRDRVVVLCIVCVFQIVFWTGFEQSPNAMMVWADKHTNLRLASSEPAAVVLEESVSPDSSSALTDANWISGIGDWFTDPSVSSGQTQSFNAFFIITVAPILAFVWLWLDRRKRQPSTPTKMVFGLVFIMIAFAVMWPAAQLESGSTRAALADLPASLQVDDEGRIYSMDEDDPQKHIHYGATRLRYDKTAGEIRMDGVLPDLDRLRLLVLSASSDFTEAINDLVDRSATRANESQDEKGWELNATLGTAPSEFKIVGAEAHAVVKDWNADTKTITVTGQIRARARVELLAMAADPAFKTAIDKIYLGSSSFRVSVWWLIGFYFFLTMGELCVSPVGLSMVTKLAPAKNVGLFMGLWFLATAISEKTAHVFGSYWGKMPPGQYFLIFVAMCGIGALLMAVLVPAMKRMTHGAD